MSDKAEKNQIYFECELLIAQMSELNEFLSVKIEFGGMS